MNTTSNEYNNTSSCFLSAVKFSLKAKEPETGLLDKNVMLNESSDEEGEGKVTWYKS